MPKQKHTVYTIAEEMGVSPSSVSKALRGSHEISEAIRLKIARHCEKIGFRQRRFTPSRINICAVVQRYRTGSRWLSGYINELVEGIAAYTTANELEFSLYSGELEALNQMDLARELKRRHVDAAVFLNPGKGSRYVSQYASKNQPYYCIQGNDVQNGERVIKLDNAAYTVEAVRVLAQMGHRKIILLSAGPNFGASEERRTGFLAAFERILGGDGREWIVEGHPEQYDPVIVGYYAGLEILRRPERPTAIISEGLKPPIGLVRAFHEQQVRIPKDISILSIGCNSELESLVPSITAINVPQYELGEVAASRLHKELISEPINGLDLVQLPKPQVVLRESVGAV